MLDGNSRVWPGYLLARLLFHRACLKEILVCKELRVNPKRIAGTPLSHLSIQGLVGHVTPPGGRKGGQGSNRHRLDSSPVPLSRTVPLARHWPGRGPEPFRILLPWWECKPCGTSPALPQAALAPRRSPTAGSPEPPRSLTPLGVHRCVLCMRRKQRCTASCVALLRRSAGGPGLFPRTTLSPEALAVRFLPGWCALLRCVARRLSHGLCTQPC
jgi:hypothetical protein